MANWKLSKIQYEFRETVTSAGTLILVASDKMYQVFTGTQNHTVNLPSATTMAAGINFIVQNNSTGTITVQNNGAVTLGTVVANSTAEFLVTDISSSNGVWRTYISGLSSNGGIGSVGPSAAKTSNYSIVTGDRGGVINVDSTSSAINITLPSPANGFNVTIKDYTGNSANNNIIVVRSSSSLTIDGEVNDDIINQNFGSISYISDGSNWFRVSSFSTDASYPRALFAGGSSGPSNVIDYISIATLGTAVSFGALTVARSNPAGCSSSIRGLFGTGYVGSSSATVDYITFSNISNATSFGSLSAARDNPGACSNSTRGIWAGGNQSFGGDVAIIDYVTIATTSNGTSFGSLTSSRQLVSGCANTTRGLFNGGTSYTTSIDYVTIATTSNGLSFGTLTSGRQSTGSCANSVRGIIAGGDTGSNTALMDYVTIATTGNATGFGNLTAARQHLAGTSSPTRGVFGGGNGPSSVIDYVTIATTSNATVFGALSSARDSVAACSNAHGGL